MLSNSSVSMEYVGASYRILIALANEQASLKYPQHAKFGLDGIQAPVAEPGMEPCSLKFRTSRRVTRSLLGPWNRKIWFLLYRHPNA